jgi:hypothetical protein
MDDAATHEENHVEKVPVLNKIFEDLIADASDLIRDLYWSVKTYLIFGLMTTLFGLQTLFYNMDQLGERFYIPVFIAGCLIFCGLVQIGNYVRLRKKYSRLFQVQDELKRS